MSTKQRDPKVEEFYRSIGKKNAKYLQSYKERNFDAIANMYTKDCRFMPSGFPIQLGATGISGFWAMAVELGFYSLWFETKETMGPIDDNWGMERCRYVFHDEKGNELQHGKYLVFWKKEDGDWKYHWDLWNPDTM